MTAKKPSRFSQLKARNRRQQLKIEEAIDRIFGKGAALQLPKEVKKYLHLILAVMGLITAGVYSWLVIDFTQSYLKLFQDMKIDPSPTNTTIYIHFLLSPMHMWITIAFMALIIIATLVISIGLAAKKKLAWSSAVVPSLVIIISSIIDNSLLGVSLGILFIYCLAQARTHYTK